MCSSCLVRFRGIFLTLVFYCAAKDSPLRDPWGSFWRYLGAPLLTPASVDGSLSPVQHPFLPKTTSDDASARCGAEAHTCIGGVARATHSRSHITNGRWRATKNTNLMSSRYSHASGLYVSNPENFSVPLLAQTYPILL